MALIKRGSFNSYKVKPNRKVLGKKSVFDTIKTFNEFGEIAANAPEEGFDLINSTEARGICINSIELLEGFEGFLQGFLNPTNEIYFVAWAWDLSGQPVYCYPGENFKVEDVVFNMKVGTVRHFLGQGINLFPKRFVRGGITVRIQIWESDQGGRDFGKTMTEVTNAIKDSSLNNTLSLISTLSGVSGVLINTIKDAALELSGIIGKIFENNKNDFVDYYEGYYDSSTQWTTGDEKNSGNSTILTLNKL